MFTGIIESIGSIRSMTPRAAMCGCCRNRQARPGDVKLGDSIAVNGVCLTGVELPGNGFAADVSRETLDCTAMNDLKAAARSTWKKP
jgi:riboflavin synthase